MKKTFNLLAILAIAASIISCEFFYPEDGGGKTVHIISMGFAYPDMHGVSELENTLRDQHGMTAQLVSLAKRCGYGYTVLEFNDASYESGWAYPANEGGNPPVREGTRYRYYTNLDAGAVGYTPLDIENGEALVSAVLDLIREKTEVGKDDILFFHYSGHGSTSGLAIPMCRGNGYAFISPSQLADALDASDCLQMVILDCCNSGIFLTQEDLAGTIGFNGKSQASPDILKIIAEAFTSGFDPGSKGIPGRFVMSAASATQESLDSDSLADHAYAPYYGAFTIWVLDYLGYDFENMDGTMFPGRKQFTSSGLYNHVYKNLTKETRLNATPGITASRYSMVFFKL